MEKQCSRCEHVYPIESFDNQKRNPSKQYAWCRDCIKEVGVTRVVMRKRNLYDDYRIMREKGISMRRFDDKMAIHIRARRLAGESVKKLAAEYNASPTTIYGTLKRAQFDYPRLTQPGIDGKLTI